MLQGRGRSLLWGIGVLASVVGACESTRNPGGIQRDRVAPTIQLTTADTSQDISGGLIFTVTATDNLGLKDIRLTYSGGTNIPQQDTVFTSTVTTITLNKSVDPGSGAGGLITIVGRASDGAGNFALDTLVIFLSNVDALRVFLLTPVPGAVASASTGIPVEVHAVQNEGIRKIGFLVSPASAVTNPTVPPSDSIMFTLPYADSVAYIDTLTVQATTGTFVVEGFAEDSGGRRAPSGRVTVAVLSAANDTTAPLVDHTVSARVEVDDSVTVHATDPSGLSWMGLLVTRASNGSVLRFDSLNVTSAPPLADIKRNFSLNLGSLIPPDSTPYSIVVRGYACDAANRRNCAFSTNSTVIQGSAGVGGGAQLVPGTDTIVVVSGVTTPFPRRPFPTKIADAIFNANPGRNELYLTNNTNDLIEVFQVANTTFVAGGIPKAGPQPWGVALWPRDTLGNYGDSIVVANAGGTQLAVMDVAARLPRWRQDLPDFLIQTYKVLTVPGGFEEQKIEFNVSDRPQYVATVCRPAGGTACDTDSIFAIYSTTPTVSSSSPFSGRATLRMEKLTSSRDTADLFGHLFYEIAEEGPSVSNDTLRIVLRRPRPYNQEIVVLSACAGVNVDINRMGLGDSTFVRNSGNFTHAFIGEGGNVSAAFARVMSYTAKGLLRRTVDASRCNTSPPDSAGVGQITDSGGRHKDFGISPGVEVRDFISNTGVRVLSIATNFNGATNAVRADSVYYLDEGLRLKALSFAPTGAPGMDMNYFHDFAPSGSCNPTCGGSGNSDNRIIFVARPDGTIAAFDTYFGYFLRSIAVRDPILGPLRVARDATGTIQYLFGVTATGVVTVRVPVFTNPPPAPPVR